MGFVAVAMCAASALPSPLVDHVLTLPRVWASALALLLTLVGALLLKASHPPAGATTLLVALGAIRTRQDAINAAIGVLIIASLGEVLRRIRLKGALVRSG
jgi:CBS-domain-containing membrane protein